MDSYIKFLQLKNHIDDAFIEKYGVDQRSIKLLESIAIAEDNSSSMTVTQLMNGGKFGSPATIHRTLSDLRDLNLLVFLNQGTNFRRKYPALTKDSREYFDNISKILLTVQIT